MPPTRLKHRPHDAVRINFDVSRATHRKLSKMPYGMRSAIYRHFIDKIVADAAKHGREVWQKLWRGEFKIVYED